MRARELLAAEEARERRDMFVYRLALTGVFVLVAAAFLIPIFVFLANGGAL